MALETRLRTTGGLSGGGIASPLGVTAGGTGTSTQFTAGSVVFAGASGVYTQNNANFFWDNTNNRLGLRTASPGTILDIGSTTTAAQTFQQVRYTGATTVVGAQTGLLVDLTTNSTPGAQSFTGLLIKVPATTRAATNAEGALAIQSTATAARVIDMQVANVGGILQRIYYPSAVTLTGLLQVFDLDAAANVTGNGQIIQVVTSKVAAGGAAGSSCYYADYRATAGSTQGIVTVAVGTATTLTGSLLGISCDLSTSVTPGANAIIGAKISIPATTRADTALEAAGLVISSTATRMRMIDCAVANTGSATGLWVLRYGTATTLTAAVVGLNVNMATNVTISGQSVTAVSIQGGSLELNAPGTSVGLNRFALKGGTATATTDWALTSGWGANATISAVTGNDSRGTVTVTTSALDTPSANPVITLTFKDGTWTSTPFAISCMVSSSTGPTTVPVSITAAATTLAVKYNGTPTATTALTYIFSYYVLG